jgi:hypothetical protein
MPLRAGGAEFGAGSGAPSIPMRRRAIAGARLGCKAVARLGV